MVKIQVTFEFDFEQINWLENFGQLLPIIVDHTVDKTTLATNCKVTDIKVIEP